MATGSPPTPKDTETTDISPQKAKRKGPVRGTRCLNCGLEPLHSAFCPDCGQENITYAVTLPVLLRDVVDEFLRFDGRLFRTLGDLFFRPGRYTAEYNAGRRGRYLSPFKIYFVVSALFFYLLARQTAANNIEREFERGMQRGAEQGINLNIGISSTVGGEVGIVSQPKRKEKAAKATTNKNPLRSPINPMIDGKAIFPENYQFEGQPLRMGNYADAYEVWQKDPANTDKHTGMHRFMARQYLRFIDHPGGLLEQYLQTVAKMMFFLLPVYAVLLAVLFRGTKRYFLEHLVFAVNQHTVAFLLGIAGQLMPLNTPATIGLFLVTYSIMEIIALRRVYQQGFLLTLLKQSILAGFYIIAILFAMLLVIFISFALL
jgi:hypothetical protein